MIELETEMKRLYGSYYSPHTILHRNIEVEYDDPSHSYFLYKPNEHDKGLHKDFYISATTIVSRFYKKFDTEQETKRMSELYGQTPEYWREKWRTENVTSIDRGNGIHEEQERFLHNVGFTTVTRDVNRQSTRPILHDRIFNVRQTTSSNGRIDISSLEDGCYPELKLWRHDWRIAGRADKPTIETISGIRYAHVEDYKTNKVIRKNGYVDKKGNERMMLEPLSHLPDCEYSHYCLQLSLYQYMLEYFDYEPGLRRLIHFPHEIEGLGIPDPVVYELPYLRDEVLAMLTNIRYV